MTYIFRAFRKLNQGEQVIVLTRLAFILWMVAETYYFCAICPSFLTPWAIGFYLLVTCILMPLYEYSPKPRSRYWLSILDVIVTSLLFISLDHPVNIGAFAYFLAVIWGSRYMALLEALLFILSVCAIYAGLAWTKGVFSTVILRDFISMAGIGLYASIFSSVIREGEKEKHKRELLLKELKNSFQEQTAAARELERMNVELKKRTGSLEEYQGELVRKNQELGLLTEVLKTTTSTLEVEELLHHAMTKTIELFDVGSAFVAMSDAEGRVERIQVTDCCCISEEECLILAKKVFPQMASTKRVHLWRYQETPPLAGTENFFLNRNINSFLATPLIVEGQVIGMMALLNSRYQDAMPERDFFEIVSSQLSLALEKARMYERLKQQAITDGLTKLYNVRHFKDRLREEIAKVDRKASSLALLMIDIDWFKEYNDSFGHQAGDALLCVVAQALTENVREGDLVARYGGEEFTVILPDSSHAEALVLANRLREKFKEVQPGCKSETERQVTLSVGVASYPEHATTVNELVELADRAMYRAKALGKDRVCSINELMNIFDTSKTEEE